MRAMTNAYESPSLEIFAPLGWDFERRLEVRGWPAHGALNLMPGRLAPVVRFVHGHAFAAPAEWLADEPFKLIERECRPNRCLIPVLAPGLNKHLDLPCGEPVVMLGALARQINTTDIAGFTVLATSLQLGEERPFIVPRRYWMAWLEPSSDVRHFIPRPVPLAA